MKKYKLEFDGGVLIYDRALSEKEIQALYKGQLVTEGLLEATDGKRSIVFPKPRRH